MCMGARVLGTPTTRRHSCSGKCDSPTSVGAYKPLSLAAAPFIRPGLHMHGERLLGVHLFLEEYLMGSSEERDQGQVLAIMEWGYLL